MKKRPDLFNILKYLFSDPRKYGQLDVKDKEQNFFMINRFISIMYPEQAQRANQKGVNKRGMVDFWHFVMRMKYNNTPNWIFTKTKKPPKKEETEFDGPVLEEYQRIFELDDKDIAEIKKFNPEGLKRSLEELKVQMEVVEK